MRSFTSVFQTLLTEQEDKKIQVRNKKSGNVYWTKKYNPNTHELITGVGKKGREKAGTKKQIVTAPIDRDVRTVVRQQLEEAAERAGQKVGYRKIMGKTYVVGITPDGVKIIYDWNGRNYTYDEFFEIEKERRKELGKLNRIHKIDEYLDSLDRVELAEVEKLKLKGEPEFRQLTDNRQLRDKVTRSYPTIKDASGRDVIVDGRFKGYYLDDMINKIGRQVAGSAYTHDPVSGKVRKLYYKDETGEVKFRVQHEPYMTLNDNNQLTVILPETARHMPEDATLKQLIVAAADCEGPLVIDGPDGTVLGVIGKDDLLNGVILGTDNG